ncbi:hypothetical protein JTE90_009493 [Oedothorax gibbosus]|uniref:BTB domain-containing protein n=1 Tax=Oedothorax gibbosus TaxID=931172 RepID=A0AAV6USP6_9ARAC|nr:hypothetical protein JTE90_009493 [Oedothorax gibbosus]
MDADIGGPRRWQKNIRSLPGGLAYIYKNGLFTDCQFIVGVKTFKGHSLVLAAKCPLFARMLKMDVEPAKRPAMTCIEIRDMTEDAFEILFNYINTNQIGDMSSQELVLDVYKAAIKYDQPNLKSACEQKILKWELTCDNVISVLQMSDVPLVKNRCWNFIARNVLGVLASVGIREASSDTMATMFERGYLIKKTLTSTELLSNVVSWAEKQLLSDVLEDGKKKKDYTLVREHLMIPCGTTFKSLMSWIGFHKFTPTELGKAISDYPKLLTDEEVRILFQYSFASEGNKPELPNW